MTFYIKHGSKSRANCVYVSLNAVREVRNVVAQLELQ